MSTRLEDDGAAQTRPAPVFVDDSGRRRRRIRIAGRVILAGAVLYVALVILSLMGSSTLPVVHVGDVSRLPRTGAGSLGALNRVTPLAPRGAHPALETAGPRTAANAVVEVPPSGARGAFPPTVTPMPNGGSPSPPTTVAPHGPPTTVPVVPTTVPTPPTTRAHGGGPPTSHPGKASRP